MSLYREHVCFVHLCHRNIPHILILLLHVYGQFYSFFSLTSLSACVCRRVFLNFDTNQSRIHLIMPWFCSSLIKKSIPIQHSMTIPK